MSLDLGFSVASWLCQPVGRDGLSTRLPAPMLDDICVVTTASDASSSARLSLSAVERLKIAIAEASSSKSSTVSAVGEHGLVAETSATSPGLTVPTAGDNGWCSQQCLLTG